MLPAIVLSHFVDYTDRKRLFTDRTSSSRIAQLQYGFPFVMSDAWDVENGIGHGAVVSGCLFNVLLNGLAA